MPDTSQLTAYNFIETYEMQVTLQSTGDVQIMHVNQTWSNVHNAQSEEMVLISVRAKCSCGNYGLQETILHYISKCMLYACI